MSITFISTHQAMVWLLVTISTLCFYVLLVRPRIKDRPEFIAFRGNVLGWLKVRWDMVAAGALVSLPSIWNGALDAMVFLSQLLGDMLPAVAGIDLSAFILPDWLTTSIRLGAAVMPILRRYLAKPGEE
jgi:hypothetical protein